MTLYHSVMAQQKYQRHLQGGGQSNMLVVSRTICLMLLMLWCGPDCAFAYIIPKMERSPAAIPIDRLTAQFVFCHGNDRINCVVDGDTFWFGGEKYRIADIDTPETHGQACLVEGALGAKATYRLQSLMNEGPFSLQSGNRDMDRYGRALRIVTRGGQSIGRQLVIEGLAREWDGTRHSWC